MAATQANITLHWLNGSRAQTIQWLLEELKVPYELDIHHRLPSMQAPPELLNIHALGKAPVLTVTPPGENAKPFVLAESGRIVQWLCDHYAQGTDLVPPRWKAGQQGQIDGETEEWMRYQFLMNYIEGSLFPVIAMYLVMSALKGSQVPFFVRPISGLVANQVISILSVPEMKKHLGLLESQLATTPNDGNYFCGAHLTAADILLHFPLLNIQDSFQEVKGWENGTLQATYPKVFAYMERLNLEEGYVRSCDKIREVNGTFSALP